MLHTTCRYSHADDGECDTFSFLDECPLTLRGKLIIQFDMEELVTWSFWPQIIEHFWIKLEL